MRPRLVALAAATAAASLTFAAPLARAQQPPVAPPAITLTPRQATVGDRISLTITVDHAEGVTVASPDLAAALGALELVDAAPPATTGLAPGRQRTTFMYTLAAFRTGEFTVPSLRLRWTDASGASGALDTEPRTVTIVSVLGPGDTSLRPLKPQLEIPQAAPSPVVPAMIVAAFALLTVAGYVIYARIVAIPPAGAAAAAAPEPPPAPPDVRARAALDALTSAGLADRDPAEYYARIAAIVRSYLSHRFGIAAYAMTRSEIAAGMLAAGADRWPARLAANLLEQCESVEFAGFRPAPDRRATDLAAAYEIVALTAEPEPQAHAPALTTGGAASGS